MDLTRNDFLPSTCFCFLVFFLKIMGRRKQLRLKWNCDFLCDVDLGLVRCVHLLFFFVFVSAQCVDVATNSGGLSESSRRCCQLHRGGQCGSPGLRSRCSCPTFNNGRLRCRPRKVSFPSNDFHIRFVFIRCNIYIFFKTKFSYGADPYLGHSIGPVPTYGISNSAELQSVNKLVRQNKNWIKNCSIELIFGFIPAGCHVPK